MSRYIDPMYRPGAVSQGPLPSADALGIGAMDDAQSRDFTNRADQIGEDYAPGSTGLEAAVHNTGPLPSLAWEGLLQALHDSGAKVVGGATPQFASQAEPIVDSNGSGTLVSPRPRSNQLSGVDKLASISMNAPRTKRASQSTVTSN